MNGKRIMEKVAIVWSRDYGFIIVSVFISDEI